MNKTASSCLLIFIGMCISFILIIALAVGITVTIVKSSIPEVKPESYLVLDYSGVISEKPQTEFSLTGSSGVKIQLLDYVDAIKKARIDPKIKGIIINGDFTFYGAEHTYELQEAIEDFKTSEKEVIAWFSRGTNANYFLCAAATKVYMPPTNSASLTLTGYSVTSSYYKELLDKLGISFNVIHIGDYKGTGENYVKQTMSDELKNSYTTLLDDFYYKRLQDIGKMRNIDPQELHKYLSTGETVFMIPEEALELKLIDGTYTYENLLASLGENENNPKTISIAEYIRITKTAGQALKSKNKIAIIYAEGAIYNYFSGSSRMQGNIVGAKSFLKDLETIKNDNDVKAVVLRVNSPGGSALASELMLRGLLELQKKKPVYVSMGPIAASGGYYISLGGSKIFVSPYTLTGSIGVVSIIPNIKNLTDNAGINFETVKKHSYDDMLSFTKDPSPEELKLLTESMLAIYNEFTGHVITRRKITKDKIPLIAEGRIWSGSQSIEQNLSDEEKTLAGAIAYAAQENDLQEDYSTISYPRPQSFFEMLASNAPSGSLVNKELENLSLDPEELRHVLSLLDFYKANNSHPAALFPYYRNDK